MTLAPPLIASSRPLFGQSLIDKRTDLDLLERFSAPGAVEQWLEGAAERGVKAVSTLASAGILAALARREDLGLQVVPVIPNVMGLVRESTEFGMIGAGLRLAMRLGWMGMIRLALRSVTKIRAVRARDFRAIMSILWDVELGQFRRFAPRCVLLHPQITDLALAMGNRDLFADYARNVRQRHGLEPGLATHNFGRLAERIEAWDLDIRLVQTPVNDAGWLMKPTAEDCERCLASERFAVIADRPGLTPPPTPDEIAAARRRPAVQSVLIDVADWKTFEPPDGQRP